MLTVYLADVLKLGQDGSGSFALSDSKTDHLELAIQYHLDVIKRVIEFDLIPQTLALNGWALEEEDIPYLSHGDISETDLDSLSKYIQRAVSVGAMSTGKSLDQSLRDTASLPAATYEENDVLPEDFQNGNSRSGDGMQTSGEGTSEDSSGDANTDNMET